MAHPRDLYPKSDSLRPLSRFITTHSPNGDAVFSSKLSSVMPVTTMADKADFSLAYTTDHFPARLGSESDIAEYESYLTQPPGISISTGSVCRVVDMPPYATSPMHRTLSLDYGVVLEGEVELILDSGDTKVMRRGDVSIQRGTNHAWKNVTHDKIDKEGNRVGQWARMLYVLLPAEEIEVEGKGKLGESVDGIGARPST
ncbi:hypothetical protein ZTR_09327 [Talaromyces verruculosus]|nr:hypothetical protein ZTR_09327 [Talaromyces verruculosus]